MSPVLLIDCDQFVFKACAAVEKETRWDDENHVLYSNENEAWDNLTGMLERIFERFGSREHVLCLSAPPNFRFGVDPTYKGNRAKQRKPLCYASLLEKVREHYTVVAMPGLEADDVMGILATKPGKSKRIIVSQDKDMKSIPTTIWDGCDLLTQTQEDADRFHLYQTLIGDTSDGYKGCPGMGPKKADALLNGIAADVARDGGSFVGVAWGAILMAYEKAGLTADQALTQARLARILRWSDWDSKKKEPILWTP